MERPERIHAVTSFWVTRDGALRVAPEKEGQKNRRPHIVLCRPSPSTSWHICHSSAAEDLPGAFSVALLACARKKLAGHGDAVKLPHISASLFRAELTRAPRGAGLDVMATNFV